MSINVITTEEFKAFQETFLNELREIKNQANKDSIKREWIRSNDIKKLLGISHGKLQELRNNGKLKFSRIDNIIYYKLSDINQMLEDNISGK